MYCLHLLSGKGQGRNGNILGRNRRSQIMHRAGCMHKPNQPFSFSAAIWRTTLRCSSYALAHSPRASCWDWHLYVMHIIVLTFLMNADLKNRYDSIKMSPCWPASLLLGFNLLSLVREGCCQISFDSLVGATVGLFLASEMRPLNLVSKCDNIRPTDIVLHA